MRRRKTRGTFAEQKERHVARQRLFDDILAAKTEPRTFRFGKHAVRSRPDLSDGTVAVVAVRRGYVLAEVGDRFDSVAHTLEHSGAVSEVHNSFAVDHVVFWCELVS